MSNIETLLAQREAIDSQIAAQKASAVQQVRDFMAVVGVTVEDLTGRRPEVTPRPPKYRDAEGRTWTGIGQRPRWLRDALLRGATLDQFAVKR